MPKKKTQLKPQLSKTSPISDHYDYITYKDSLQSPDKTTEPSPFYQKFEQLFLLGQICKYSGNTVLSKTNYAHVTTDGVTLQFINQLRLEAIQLSTVGSSIILNITSADVKSARFQMPNWQANHSISVMAADMSESWSVDLEKDRATRAKNVKSVQDDEMAANILIWVFTIGLMLMYIMFGNW